MRVEKTAREMGYVPSHAARQLRTQRTETLGLIFPVHGARFTDPFFSEFMAGVGDEANRLNYDLLISSALPGEREHSAYQRWVNSRRVDGFVLVRMRVEDWRIHYLSEQGIPFVAFGRSASDGTAPCIDVNGRGGMKALVSHLAGLGRRRIAYIGAPPQYSFARERELGFREGMEQANLACEPKLMLQGSLTRSGGFEAAARLLKQDPLPEAIVAVNDLTALGAIQAAEARGLAVGHDIAIAGFDGTEASEHSHPPLTTVSQPVYSIGRMVSSTLIDLIEGRPVRDPQQIIQPELIIRASTAGEENQPTPENGGRSNPQS